MPMVAPTVAVTIKAVSILLTEPIHPYVRMTRGGKWMAYKRKGDKVIINPAQQYIANQELLKRRIKEQLQEKGHRIEDLPIFKNRQPLRAHITFIVSKDLHRKDLDNLIKAILDAAQGLIFENDLWIDTITAERSLGQEDLAELVLLCADRSQDASPRPQKAYRN